MDGGFDGIESVGEVHIMKGRADPGCPLQQYIFGIHNTAPLG